jgi:ketosteroid isomerase-like protein
MSAARPPADVVRVWWAALQARDWDGARALLHDDVVLDWPASRERLVGADAVMTANREYPEGWTIEVLRVVSGGAQVVSEVEVGLDGVQHRAASFWQVRRGALVAGVEYWTSLGQDEPSPARAAYAQRY